MKIKIMKENGWRLGPQKLIVSERGPEKVVIVAGKFCFVVLFKAQSITYTLSYSCNQKC